MCVESWQTDYDWKYQTVPQAHCNNRVINWPRGKLFGGSSSINAMLYVRGNEEDYDNWELKYGCKGWSFKNVLPYFKKSEKCSLTVFDKDYHGLNGYLNVEETTRSNPNSLSRAFVKACRSFGFGDSTDINGKCQEGATVSPVISF